MNLYASFLLPSRSVSANPGSIPITRLHFDGLCEPRNPGGWCCGGWVLTHPDGSKTRGNRVLSPPGPESTNNAAEWGALIAGIEAAKAAGATCLEIRGDSQLVVNQLTGHFQVHAPRMREFLERAQAVLRGIKWTARWIPRDGNSDADAESRRAYESIMHGRIPAGQSGREGAR